eukprot:12747449-Ditylum_brightwellii.AAC.1
MERSKQNKHVVGNKDNGVDNSLDDSVENSVGDSDDSADKHLIHLSQAVDCCLMERGKQNVCVVGDKDDDVDVDVDNSVDNSVDDSDYSVDKHLTHLSQAVDCHSPERSK